jgi:hypothetical protein
LSEISVGNASNVWGVNAQNQIYQWNGTSFVNVPGSLDEVWATYDGGVWGSNSSSSAYQYNSTTKGCSFMGNNVRYVVLGNAANVWAVNATSGAVYAWF